MGTGDAVKAGQLLARLDPQNEMNALRSAQARLTAAQGRLREARNVFAREQSLLARRYTTKTNFDQALTAVETTKSDIEDATAQLKIAQDNVSYTELRTDAAGTIVARAAEAGEVVQPGQVIFRLARTGGWDAVFDVPARILRDAPRDARVDLALTDDRERDRRRPGSSGGPTGGPGDAHLSRPRDDPVAAAGDAARRHGFRSHSTAIRAPRSRSPRAL